jgi:5-methylcytosine-specific restriction endonuclease McrA
MDHDRNRRRYGKADDESRTAGRGQPRIYQDGAGLVIPSDLEGELNDLAESLDGLPVTEARLRYESGVWDALGMLVFDDRSNMRPRRTWVPRAGTPAYQRAASLIEKHHVRALSAGVVSTLTEGEWLAILDAQEGRCLYCDDRTWLTVEHLIPISRRGENTAANVIAVCSLCNSQKGATDLFTWLAKMGIDADLVLERLESSRFRRGAS